MALQIWLPLISDLRQQGIADTSTITLASGNAFVNGGKVGNKALHLTKQQTILGTSSCMSGKKQMSYAFWVKVNTAWSAQWLDGIAWYSTDGSSATYSRQEFYTNCTRIGTWFSGSSLSGYVFTPGEWTHIAGTFDYTTGIAKFYINGILQGTSTSLSKTHYCRGDFYLGDSGVDIVENDIRIYDHCLSSMEVKELAKGLVLHYPLNRGGWGQENLIITNSMAPTSGTSGWSSAGTGWANSNVTSSGASNGHAIRCTYSGTTQTSGGIHHPTGNTKGDLTDGATYTVSARIRASKACRATFHNELQTINNVIDLTTDWKIYSFSSPIDNSKTYHSNTIYVQAADATQNMWIECDWIKLEEGSIATPWCPNSADVLATTMGLNGTTEYDCSGFCNNGTRTGTFSWASDTPKYSVSQVFASGNNYIDCGASQEILPTDGLTVSLWCKYSTWGNPASCTEGGGWNFENNSGIAFPVYIAGVGYKVASSGITPDTYLNQWHMITGTFDKTNVKIYIDGVLKGTVATGSTNGVGYAANHCYVGAEAAGSTSIASASFIGSISDFRIYATALSADDIKSLYQNCATIDPDGTIRGQIRS